MPVPAADRGSIPAWDVADLPEPKPLSWRNIPAYVGPGIVMMGIQIGGGEWLFGPEITAKYGGGLMWIASVAIVLQVFYNLECGRYALYCGEPIFTGFMRKTPGAAFWFGFMVLLNLASFIPGLSSHGAAIIASLILNRPPGEEDRALVRGLSFACLFGVAAPVLVGGKVYNMLQTVMTAKVLFVLGFCLFIGVAFVSPENWWNVFSGFARFGNVPVTKGPGEEGVVNVFSHFAERGAWPAIALSNIAALGAFAGYAGGGGLSNSTYSNFVRDKGWGMGSLVGAIPSAIGGKQVTLSHVGKVFETSSENLRRWKGWWRYILMDQFIVWAPGCFMGMALPALISIQFAPYSNLFHAERRIEWAQALISADGLRQAPIYSPAVAKLLWLAALFAGLAVMLPSQMSIVDDFSRRWTDAIWTAVPVVRKTFRANQVQWIYYGILSLYVLWSFVFAYALSTPRLMTLILANLNNVAIGLTSLQLLWINLTLLPRELRPRWHHVCGLLGCAVFYLGFAGLVFYEKQWPALYEFLKSLSSATA
jgi:hypothetical protein